MTHTRESGFPLGATYDPDADALYLRLRVAPHGRTVEDGPNRFLHLDRDDSLYAVELLRVHERAAEDAARLLDEGPTPMLGGRPVESAAERRRRETDEQVAREEDDLGPGLGGTPGKMGGGR